MPQYCKKSQSLIEAQFALAATGRERAAAVESHLNRVSRAIEREKSELGLVGCRGVGNAISDIIEAEQSLNVIRLNMKGVLDPP
jgi:hypothetical protein